MSRHNEMPPIPPASRSTKGPGGSANEEARNASRQERVDNAAEQGETANIKQNTTNEGFYRGRRVK
ncbi:hypothetical protein E0H22_19530 [Rhodopseudomonas boonkerdii]|nr:hypothetical protein E0H22_19530 [Rhodopseudomonas boonkerdii]